MVQAVSVTAPVLGSSMAVMVGAVAVAAEYQL